MSEDRFVGVIHLQHFISHGCYIAPVEVALKWSLEYSIEEFPNWKLENSFGFHGLTKQILARKHLKL